MLVMVGVLVIVGVPVIVGVFVIVAVLVIVGVFVGVRVMVGVGLLVGVPGVKVKVGVLATVGVVEVWLPQAKGNSPRTKKVATSTKFFMIHSCFNRVKSLHAYISVLRTEGYGLYRIMNKRLRSALKQGF